MQKLTVATWNCGGAFRKKFDALDVFKADVLVIQECEDPSRSTDNFREWATNHLWDGENKNKGIGVFAREHIKLEALGWPSEDLKSFLPCRLQGQVPLIAVWTKQTSPEAKPYIGQLWRYIAAHRKRLLQHSPFVLCGDFNSSTRWDQATRNWNHSDVVRELEELGALSLYHDFFNEQQGAETRPTLYHQRNEAKPYHVDFAFASKQLWNGDTGRVSVGDCIDWLQLSDHMPVCFSLSMPSN